MDAPDGVVAWQRLGRRCACSSAGRGPGRPGGGGVVLSRGTPAPYHMLPEEPASPGLEGQGRQFPLS